MFAPDLDPRFGRFGLRSDCPSCGAHLPVNGPTTSVDCADCGDTVRVPPEVVLGLLEAFEEGWPEAEHAGSTPVGDMTWRWTAGAVGAPSCIACGASLPAPAAGGPVTCNRCRTSVPVLDTPGWVRSAVHTAIVVVGGEVEPRRPDTGDRPVALSCPSCGAALAITGSHLRVTPCSHCGSRVHIPDAVWRALHPARKAFPWFVRFEGESRPARAARVRLETAARERRAADERAERHAARSARERAERDTLNRADAEARAARLRRESEARRRRLALTIPLLGLTWIATASAVACTLFAGAWVVVGPRAWALAGLRPTEAALLGDGAVVTAIALFVPAWLLGILTARFHAGRPILAVLPWCVVMLVLCAIPFAGAFFALLFGWLHLRGREPTISADERLPWLTTLPLAVLHLLAGALAHVVYATIGQASALGWLPM
jgi:predicted RNA-binding Zn-ribbon protein involved in translation (DUF1610 family)